MSDGPTDPTELTPPSRRLLTKPPTRDGALRCDHRRDATHRVDRRLPTGTDDAMHDLMLRSPFLLSSHATHLNGADLLWDGGYTTTYE